MGTMLGYYTAGFTSAMCQSHGSVGSGFAVHLFLGLLQSPMICPASGNVFCWILKNEQLGPALGSNPIPVSEL